MNTLLDTWAFFLRQTRTTLRLPATVVMSCINPLIWMVFFAPLFRSVSDIPGFHSHSYYEFLTPGVAIMGALFASSYSGLSIFADMQSGLLDKFLATPVTRAAILAGPILSSALQSTCQAAVVLVTAVALGARPAGGVSGVLVMFVAVWLLGLAFATLSHGIAIRVSNPRQMFGVLSTVLMPMMFLSTAMMTPALMPRWIRVVAQLNPVNWAVTLSRSGFTGALDAHAWTPVVLLISVVMVAWMVAVRGLARFESHR